MMTLEELTLQVERLQAAQACRNLMGRYAYYHTAFRHKDYMTLWAERDDSYFKFPFGYYVGIDAIRHCYLVEHGDRADPGMEKKMQGIMTMHQLDTEVLEVAADGRTAKGVWISPGHETFLRAPEGVENPTAEEKKADPMWAWSKYEVEFIRENGQWKLWHMVLYPLFKTSYYKAWTDSEEVTEKAINEEAAKDKPAAPPFWQWSKTAIYPADEPEPPVPYDTVENMPHKIIVPEK